MYFNALRLKYSLEGNSNYIAWKDMMEALLKDSRLKALIDSDTPQPAAANAQHLDAWKKNVAKERRIFLEGF